MDIIVRVLCFGLFACSSFAALHSQKFYIYEWGSKLSDVWPPPDTQLASDSVYAHRYRGGKYAGIKSNASTVSTMLRTFVEEGGEGIVLDPDIGLFCTWQMSLYQLVMSRLRVSEHRTMYDIFLYCFRFIDRVFSH